MRNDLGPKRMEWVNARKQLIESNVLISLSQDFSDAEANCPNPMTRCRGEGKLQGEQQAMSLYTDLQMERVSGR
jgi:hypothetical protein